MLSSIGRFILAAVVVNAAVCSNDNVAHPIMADQKSQAHGWAMYTLLSSKEHAMLEGYTMH